jgi:hypothetical protein
MSIKKLISALFGLLLLCSSNAFAATTQCITSASAGGTANAITIPLLPCGFTTNLLLLTLSSTNTISAVTIQMTGFSAQPVINANGTDLAIGEFQAGGTVLLTPTGSQWKVLAVGSPGVTTVNATVVNVTGGATVALSAESQTAVITSAAAATIIDLPNKGNWPLCGSVANACPEITVKDGALNAGTYPITVTTTDSTNIDGQSTYIMPFDGEATTFILNGTEWLVK